MGSNKLRSNLFARLYDHDPAAATAIICSPDGGTTKRYIDMRDYLKLMVLAMSSTLTGAGITLLEIIADEAVTFSDPVVVKTSGVVAADAVGDQVVLECLASEIAALGAANSKDLRYVAARLTLANAADEAVVAYVAVPRWARDALTGNVIA